ncbi:hypothetical protein TcCL_Unassigned01778 [Trypanosoma cruzi]|nr:hypothetical protein TcCL_Unassigned01778 [Trypanosoma cruzi]
MCRHIHREGNGGPFLFPCAAGGKVARCVHRIGHMAHSTQLTVSAMHAHIKAAESIILMLSLGTGSRTLLPRPLTHARDGSGCRHSEHTTHPPAQPPHPHHQIHVQHSQQPSRTRTSSSSTRAQGPTRRRTVTIVIIAVNITRSGVAGVSQLIRETEGKGMEREGEGRSTANTARERRQHEERASGPAAHFTHHGAASTQERHTTPAATHHAGGEDIHHHLPQLIATANGKCQNPAATTQRTRSEHPPHQTHDSGPSSMTRQQDFLPSRPQWDTEPNSTHSHAVHHTRRKGDSGCALPLLRPSPHSNGRRQQQPHATASMRYKRSLQIE